MRNKKNLLLIVAFVGMFATNALAQRKFRFNVEYAYMVGLKENYEISKWSLTRSDVNMYANSFRVAALCPVSDAVALGIGLGLDCHKQPDDNSVPFYATARYAPLKCNRDIYAFADFGFPLSKSSFFKSPTMDFGIGYKWMIMPKFGITFKAGYNIKTKGDDALYVKETGKFINTTRNMTHTRHSLFVGTGVIF